MAKESGGRGVPRRAGKKGKRHGGTWYANAFRRSEARKIKRIGHRAFRFALRRERGLLTSDDKRRKIRAEIWRTRGDAPLPVKAERP
jgi:isocitrate/isopropylmalate dehydrogenase